jgi:nucleotide-binding universal stress UspA family protein
MSGLEEFRPTGVVVGDDGSDNAREAVAFAVEEAARRGVPLHIVRAYSVLSAPRPKDVPFGYVASEAELGDAVHAELAEQWSGLAIPVELHAVSAPTAEALIAAGESADLVVIGARGTSRLEGLLLGSVAGKVIQLCRCPVTIVKA